MPSDVEIAHSEMSKEDNDDETISPLPRLYGEEPVLKIPTAPDIPPVVIHRKEPISLDATAVAKGISGALARLIGN